MGLSKLMSRNLITLDLDDDMGKAKVIFDTTKIHHIMITDGGELVGIITDRDVYKNLSPFIGTSKETPKDTVLLQKKVHLIMSRKLITATETTTLNESVLLFHDNHVSCLPVINEQNKLVGIITWRDILKLLAVKYREKSNK